MFLYTCDCCIRNSLTAFVAFIPDGSLERNYEESRRKRVKLDAKEPPQEDKPAKVKKCVRIICDFTKLFNNILVSIKHFQGIYIQTETEI